MNNAGEYGKPIQRPTVFNAPVISTSGSITARLVAKSIVSGVNRAENAVLTTVHNVGTTSFTVQFVETGSRDGGTRSNVGSAFAVVPGGFKTATLFPALPLLEMQGTAGGGEARVEMTSLIEYQQQGFGKDDAVAPVSLWKAQNVTPEAQLDT